MTHLDDIHPYVWWVKINEVYPCPVGFELHGDGTLYARWGAGGLLRERVSDEDMRCYGYEKCFCNPFEGHPAADCIAHPGGGSGR